MKNLDCFNIKNGYYKISEDGKIWSNIYNRYLRYETDKDGYKDVRLVCNDGKRRCFKVHRLVAAMYNDNPNNYPIVMHKDNNKSNNHFKNLKWGTVKENTIQAYEDGCCSSNRPVCLYDRKTKKFIRRFNSLGDLARYFGYSPGTVGSLGKVCSGEHPQYTTGKLKYYIISYERLYINID